MFCAVLAGVDLVGGCIVGMAVVGVFGVVVFGLAVPAMATGNRVNTGVRLSYRSSICSRLRAFHLLPPRIVAPSIRRGAQATKKSGDDQFMSGNDSNASQHRRASVESSKF